MTFRARLDADCLSWDGRRRKYGYEFIHPRNENYLRNLSSGGGIPTSYSGPRSTLDTSVGVKQLGKIAVNVVLVQFRIETTVLGEL